MEITRSAGPNSTIDLQSRSPPSDSPRHRGVRPAPRPPHARPRLPPGQGAASRSSNGSWPRALSSTTPLSTSSRLVPRRARPGGHPAADECRGRRRPGGGRQAAIFKATLQVRPEVALGDYRNFNFAPEIDPIDDARVNQVIDELRDQNATLAAVEDRGAQDGDYAVISFEGPRDGEPFEGGTSERMPLILGQSG